ncbi:uncharacterized protein CLAFUR5_04025 [Fulvia fulva]|uniref:F-box domain-containing protein n=1 Tax=Passalora fulva TaxID=5499 RepID=A0A9Q8LE57_PASFU|nr:uncharacterized protein CLAFUR5_04025 [Fulvia fulva]UJO15876.1 hypothetical protein CLAFUR5_04025 [Fulvia fulva]
MGNMAQTTYDLPDELLATIFGHLQLPLPIVDLNREDDFDRTHGLPNRLGYTPEQRRALSSNFKTLCRLSVVSKSFNSVAESILYRTDPGQDLVDPDLFLAALAARPHRTKFVRRVLLGQDIFGHDLRWRDWYSIRRSLLHEPRNEDLQELGQGTNEDVDPRPWPELEDLNIIRRRGAEARQEVALKRGHYGHFRDAWTADDYKSIAKTILHPRSP